MITIKGCTSDLIDDISEFIGSLSIADVEVIDDGDDGDEPLYEIELSEKTVLFYHPDEVIIQKSVEESSRYAIPDFRFEEVIIK